MDRHQILNAIDEEISRLERVKALLASSNGTYAKAAKAAPTNVSNRSGKKRVLSDEARARIAQAQKRRWAKQRKEASAVAKG